MNSRSLYSCVNRFAAWENPLVSGSVLLALALLASCVSSRPTQNKPDKEVAPHVPNELLVRFRGGMSDEARMTALAGIKGAVIESEPLLPDLYVVTVPDSKAAIEKLENDERVLYVHYNYLLGSQASAPSDAHFGWQWGLSVEPTPSEIPGIENRFTPLPDADIEAPLAWAVHQGDPDFVIAVIDSGLNVDSYEFEGNLWRTAEGVGWDFLNNGPVKSDFKGHGTRVSSIIGARANDGQPQSMVGVNWYCKIMPLCFIGLVASNSEALSVSGSVADAIRAIRFSVDNGVKVSNNSYGARGIDDALGLIEAIQYARDGGQLFVTCAGNFDADLSSTPFYPAAFNRIEGTFDFGNINLDNMLVVTSYDDQSQLVNQVGYGNLVDIAAPGYEILTMNHNGSYLFGHGTSFATAFVSGAAALLWSKDDTLSYADVKARILATARVDPGLSSKVPGGRALYLGNLWPAVVPIEASVPPATTDDAEAAHAAVLETPSEEGLQDPSAETSPPGARRS